MNFDRKKVFDGIRKSFGKLTQPQVKAIDGLLDGFTQDSAWSDVRHIAYALATIRHETANTYAPIHEYGSTAYFNRRYGPNTTVGKKLGNTQKGDGARFAGRGFAQLTGRTNYTRYGLQDNPDDAMRPDVAFEVLTDGMFHGRFTGKKLSDYIKGSKCDYINARRIINGTDKAGLIAGYAKDFERILQDSVASNVPLGTTPVEDTESTNTPEPSGDTATPPTILDKANQLGDQTNAWVVALEKFGISIPDAKRSLGTIVLTWAKFIFSGVLTVVGIVSDHWELFVIAGLLVVVAYLLWNNSGNRAAMERQGVPEDVIKALVDKKGL